MRGITLLQVVENITKRGSAQADKAAGMKFLVEVGLGKAVEAQFDIGAPVFAGADGVGLCQQVALVAVAE